MEITPLTDARIAQLLAIPKPLSSGWRDRFAKLKKSGSQSQAHLTITVANDLFRISVRQNTRKPTDFSAILGWKYPGTNVWINLKRYNGLSHEHTNKIERDTFFDYHIHTATERYQWLGGDAEAFAECTDRYTTLDGALACLIEDCGFVLPDDERMQINWFRG